MIHCLDRDCIAFLPFHDNLVSLTLKGSRIRVGTAITKSRRRTKTDMTSLQEETATSLDERGAIEIWLHRRDFADPQQRGHLRSFQWAGNIVTLHDATSPNLQEFELFSGFHTLDNHFHA